MPDPTIGVCSLREVVVPSDELLAKCKRLFGHGAGSPADLLQETAEWCRERGVIFDHYGRGAVLEDLEQRVAELLGFPAARFMPSGTMAQCIALKVWGATSPHFAMHPLAHVEMYEDRAYSHLYGLRATLVGERHRPLLAADLAAMREPISALLVELPLRDAGGILPTWEELQELKQCAAHKGIRLHLDGARLWESAPFYNRSLAEICQGFDSVYVSFYKGIGALSGAMLLGPVDFLRQAEVWQHRAGGTLYTQVAHAASAAMLLEKRIPRMAVFVKRCRSIAAAVQRIEGVQVIPDPPHVNMMQVVLPLAPEVAEHALERLAEERELFLGRSTRRTRVPGTCALELYIGEAAMAWKDDEVEGAFRALLGCAAGAPDSSAP